MSRSAPVHVPRGSILRALLPVLVLLGLALSVVSSVAADPSFSPVAVADLRMTARPLLGGTVRPGAWMAIRVLLENDGPAVTGELQVSGGQQGDSRYGMAVELPTGARQEHILYAQPAWFNSGLAVQLVSGSRALLHQALVTRSVDPYTPIVVVVAEHPEGIVADIRAGTTTPNLNPPVILTVPASELPPRVEAWSAIDRLVWQDVDSSSLTEDQVAALRGWVGAGGRLVVVGGSTGITTLGAFPDDLLPFRPAQTIDVPSGDLADVLGTVPADATTLPAVSGLLDAGTVLGRSGDHVYAAQRTVGQGVVTLVGIDPSVDWLAGTSSATAFWRRYLPTGAGGAVINPLVLQDDSQIVSALSNLPAVDLPDLGVLFGLLVAYIVLIGPINYLVLRRLDRREWAWVTMPLLVGVFAVAAWGLGTRIKGTDVIVNEVGIVRTAAGTDQGIGQVYVGVFSPTRASYQVGVGGSALLTNPVYLAQSGQTTVPLDVVLGETSTLRDFEVGFAVLRTFRAEAAVAVPRLDADLEYHDGVLTGTLTNRSDRPLEAVALLWGGTAKRLDTLAPGVSVPVSMRVSSVANDGRALSEMVFGPYPQDGVHSRTELTRRMVLDQLWWSSGMGNGAPQQGPMVLAWTSGPELDVQLGTPAKRVGDTLNLYPAPMKVSGPSIWTTALLGRSIVSSDANDASDQGTQLSLSRGTMTVEWRPLGFGGPFTATGLSMMLTQGEMPALTGRAPEVQPLPADQQPAQDDPLSGVTLSFSPDGTDVKVPSDGSAAGNAAAVPVPAPATIWDGLPAVQVFDRVTGTWIELPHAGMRQEFRIADPARYVDDSGAVLVRFVNRGGPDMTTWFTPLVRLEGDAG